MDALRDLDVGLGPEHDFLGVAALLGSGSLPLRRCPLEGARIRHERQIDFGDGPVRRRGKRTRAHDGLTGGLVERGIARLAACLAVQRAPVAADAQGDGDYAGSARRGLPCGQHLDEDIPGVAARGVRSGNEGHTRRFSHARQGRAQYESKSSQQTHY